MIATQAVSVCALLFVRQRLHRRHQGSRHILRPTEYWFRLFLPQMTQLVCISKFHVPRCSSEKKDQIRSKLKLGSTRAAISPAILKMDRAKPWKYPEASTTFSAKASSNSLSLRSISTIWGPKCSYCRQRLILCKYGSVCQLHRSVQRSFLESIQHCHSALPFDSCLCAS